jgi:hypothetical protein
VVDREVHPELANLTAFGQEPMDQLVARGADQCRSLIDKDCRALPLQGDPADAGDQWFPSTVAFDRDLQAGRRSDRCWHRHLVASGYLGDRGTVFTGQGLSSDVGVLGSDLVAQERHRCGAGVIKVLGGDSSGFNSSCRNWAIFRGSPLLPEPLGPTLGLLLPGRGVDRLVHAIRVPSVADPGSR